MVGLAKESADTVKGLDVGGVKDKGEEVVGAVDNVGFSVMVVGTVGAAPNNPTAGVAAEDAGSPNSGFGAAGAAAPNKDGAAAAGALIAAGAEKRLKGAAVVVGGTGVEAGAGAPNKEGGALAVTVGKAPNESGEGLAGALPNNPGAFLAPPSDSASLLAPPNPAPPNIPPPENNPPAAGGAEAGVVLGAPNPPNKLGAAEVAGGATEVAPKFNGAPGVPGGVVVFPKLKPPPAPPNKGFGAAGVENDGIEKEDAGAPPPNKDAGGAADEVGTPKPKDAAAGFV